MSKQQPEIFADDYLASLMMDYACGALDEGLALVMASYISLSPYAQAQLRYLESIGGVLLCQDCEPEPMKEDSLVNVLDRLDEMLDDATQATEPECADICAEIKNLPCGLPAPIARQIAAKMAQTPCWTKQVKGIEIIDIPLHDACRNHLQIMKIAPAAAPPEHTHRGVEITLVLDGAFSDHTGSYEAGTLVVHDDKSRHQPVACKNQGCVCVVATDTPLRFTRSFWRLLNPFMR